MKLLEWLQTDGSCRFPTTTSTGSGYTYVLRNVRMALSGSSLANRSILTTGTTSSASSYLKLSSNSSNRWLATAGSTVQFTCTDPSGYLEAEKIVMSDEGIAVDDLLVSKFSKVIPSGYTLHIFGAKAASLTTSMAASGTRLGALEVYNSSGTLTANWVAARDNSDVLCFYNTVNQSYIYNAESGTLTAGPEVSEPLTGTVIEGKMYRGSIEVEKEYGGSTEIMKQYDGSVNTFRRKVFSPVLFPNPGTLTFEGTDTAKTVEVSCNSNWSVSTTSSWLTVQRDGNTLTVTPSDNTSTTYPRTGRITLTATDGTYTDTRIIPVLQGKGVTSGSVTLVDYIHRADSLVSIDTGSNERNYIDTGITVKGDTSFNVQAHIPNGGKYTYHNGTLLVGYTIPNTNTIYALSSYYKSGNGWQYFQFKFGDKSCNHEYAHTSSVGINITCGNIYSSNTSNFYMTNNLNTVGSSVWTTSTARPSSITNQNATIKVDVCSWWFNSLKIWEGDIMVFDGHAALDPNNVPCIYDSITGRCLTNPALSLTYEQL